MSSSSRSRVGARRRTRRLHARRAARRRRRRGASCSTAAYGLAVERRGARARAPTIGRRPRRSPPRAVRAVAADVPAGVASSSPRRAATLLASLALVHDHVDAAAGGRSSSSGIRRAGACGATRPARTSPTTSRGSRSPTSSRTARSSPAEHMAATDWDVRPVRARRSRGRGGVGGRTRRSSRRRWGRREPAAASEGYAMLAALLVIVLAATFALVVVGAVHSMQVVERRGRARRGGRRRAEGQALAAVARVAAVAAVGLMTGRREGATPAAEGSWRVSLDPAARRRRRLAAGRARSVATSAGRRAGHDDLVLELRSEPWAMGVTCAGDADVDRAARRVRKRRLRRRLPHGAGRTSRFVAGAGSVTPAGRPPTACAATSSRPPRCTEARASSPAASRSTRLAVAAASSRTTPTGTRSCRSRRRGWRALGRSSCWPPGPQATPPGPALSEGRLELDAAAAGREPRLRRRPLPRSCRPSTKSTIEGSPPPDAGRLLVVVHGDAVARRARGDAGALRRARRQRAPGGARRLSVIEGVAARRAACSVAGAHASSRARRMASDAPCRAPRVPTLVERGG